MANFTISFRIADAKVGGRDYADRYQALVDAIKSLSTVYWDRSTAFFALTSNHDIDRVTATCKAAIAPAHDLVLVLDADVKSGRVTGSNPDQDLFRILPYVKNV